MQISNNYTSQQNIYSQKNSNLRSQKSVSFGIPRLPKDGADPAKLLNIVSKEPEIFSDPAKLLNILNKEPNIVDSYTPFADPAKLLNIVSKESDIPIQNKAKLSQQSKDSDYSNGLVITHDWFKVNPILYPKNEKQLSDIASNRSSVSGVKEAIDF